MATAHINIGSNLGDRHALIERAVAAIEQELDADARRSNFVESPPWGYDSPNMFLNLGISIPAGSLSPLELLHRLRTIQDSINPASHRDIHGSYADRAIDIDLIAVDSVVLKTEELTLPHPRMHLREFVLVPLSETAPEWIHPSFGLTPAGLLQKLRHGSL